MSEPPKPPSRRAVVASSSTLIAGAAAAAAAAAEPTPGSLAGRFVPPMAATFPLVLPRTELAWEAYVEIAAMQDLGEGPLGRRRIVPITGGRFAGPRLAGVVLPGGADRQLVRKDGVTRLEALYEMRTDDGAVITVTNRVTIDRQPDAPPYMFSSVEAVAPDGPHAWLNRSVFVGTLHPLPPERRAVVVRVYRVV